MFLRDGGAEEAERLHLLDHALGILVAMLQIAHLAAHLALEPPGDGVEGFYFHFGGRFSMNAFIPSRPSSLAKLAEMTPEARS